jgi:hypothetical protein
MTEMNLTPEQKLQRVQELAKRLDQQLYGAFQCNKTYMEEINGGNLFAGPYYAESDRMYFSLNPGGWDEPACFDVRLWEKEWYWGITGKSATEKAQLAKNPYWQMSNYFFNSQPTLVSWMAKNKFTTTFVVPWRTRSIASLQNDPKLERAVWHYSCQIIQQMFKDCTPKLLIVSGQDTLKYLRASDCLNCAYTEEARLCYANSKPHPLHPCSKGRLHCGADGGIVTFVIPHFARAKSKPLLEQCAQWLKTNL